MVAKQNIVRDIVLKDSAGQVIANLESFRWTMTREMAPIYTTGSSKPTIIRGKRSVAGSFVVPQSIPAQDNCSISFHYDDGTARQQITLPDVSILWTADEHTTFVSRPPIVEHDSDCCCSDCLVCAQPMTAPVSEIFFMNSLADLADNIHPQYILEKRCECGAEKCGSLRHSEWCCKYEESK